ncbi:Zn-dependent hydrolases, including glyoxylases [alpha proteobacterium U9-1i]|nr:Zn-dependent hydrolases, including glyoxylases [alpha proteobacterium U9-1i]
MISALILSAALQAAVVEASPPPVELARGVHMIYGGILPNRGPDGNTVIFDAPDGLIVVDTGRHVWHSDAILAFAQAHDRPIAAMFNTHWHLDHSSGNRRIKAVFPNARVYTTNAIDRALSPEGFLRINRNEAQLQAMLEDPNVPEIRKDEIRNGLATMDASDQLRPDVQITRSERMRVAGRRLDVRVTDGAVTDADVWLYDRRTRIVVMGDLVTFPAPFFESACPNRWRAALDAVWETPFRIAVPGHGAPMNRDQFNAYRGAFNGFVDCVATEAEPAQCSTIWVDGVAQFLPDDAARDEARQYADYYVGFLRRNGGKGQTCLAD